VEDETAEDQQNDDVLVELESQFLPRSEFKVESLSLFEAKDDLQTLGKYLLSVRWKLVLAGYHMSEALAAVPSAIPKDEPDKKLAAFAMHWNLMHGHDEGEPME
jgi:hypothetical protein